MSETSPEGWRDWPEDRKLAFLERLRVRAARWEGIARAAQRPPAGDWYLWALVGGRGSGKTRAGAEWLAAELRGDGRGDESAIVAPRFSDARDTCVEGPSGLLVALRAAGPRSPPGTARSESFAYRAGRSCASTEPTTAPCACRATTSAARSATSSACGEPDRESGRGRSRCFRPCASEIRRSSWRRRPSRRRSCAGCSETPRPTSPA